MPLRGASCGSSTHRVTSGTTLEALPPTDSSSARILGTLRLPGWPGRTLVLVTGGIHGNEPAGVQRGAARDRRKLSGRQEPAVRGQDRGRWRATCRRPGAARQAATWPSDLNRVLERGAPCACLRVARPRHRTADRRTAEQRELLDAHRHRACRELGRPDSMLFVDLHTTSGGGPPFSLPEPTRCDNRRDRVEPFRVPVILGLEESIDGTSARVRSTEPRRSRRWSPSRAASTTDPVAIDNARGRDLDD